MAPCMSHANMEMTMTDAAKPQNVAVWFEIPAADFDRAVGFYEKIFETRLRREKFGPADLAVFPYDGNAVSGCVMKAEGFRPAADGCVVYLRTERDLAGPLAKVASAGGRVSLPKTALPPGMGFFAHFVDSEGNRVGLHSMV
jgi:predicted enzyme related to lactoylglutathione lyase